MAPPTCYDEVPYADDPYPSSHPGHLAVVAILAGLTPVPVEGCRVLEIGCARGGNLIPMAVGLPRSSFLGIDSSAGQVASARSVIEALGLENVAIECRSLLDVDADLGTFDYIICHGTYSWVDAEARGKILEILAGHLAPDGLAYLSYNAFPGWRLRGLARDLMAYHAGHDERPADRAREARRVLEFMAASAAPFDRTYASWLREECAYLRDRPASYLLHDHLEEFNEPAYFHELAGRAAAAGLRFVSEVQGGVLDVESFPPAAAAGLRELAADEVEFEQYLDFLINRKFRQSVFCRAGREPSRRPHVEDLARLEVAARDPGSLPPVAFRDERRLRAVLELLAAAWPSAIPWGSLVRAARARLAPAPGGTDEVRDDPDLTADLLRCYRLKVVEFQAHRWPFVSKAGDRPLASPLARYQAGLGDTVTNLRHEAGRLGAFGRMVLSLLDGRRDRAEILGQLRTSQAVDRHVMAGPLLAPPDDAPAPRHDGNLEAALDRCLETLARFALLMR